MSLKSQESPTSALAAGKSVYSRRAFLDASLAGASTLLLLPRALAAAQQVGPSSDELAFLTIQSAAALVRAKRISPVELTQACLRRIERFNPQLNAFITVTADSALADARHAEAEIQRGRWRGALHGIPIGLKDLIDTAGVRTTSGSALYRNRIPTEDAEVARRLRAAGAVLIGKHNLHEFAYGGSSAVSFFGPVHNPWNSTLCSGGSSGGSAAAVAARLCYGAIGTDTGGSIREPASYCGIVGLKPTYGRVSTFGVQPLSWSLDHLGPMTRTVQDAALMLQVIAGYDALDTGSVDTRVPDYIATLKAGNSSLRLGILRAYFCEELHPEIQTALETALSVLKSIGGAQRDIAPLATDATYASVIDPYAAILNAEAYAIHHDNISSNPELYQAPTLERIRAGANVTTEKYIQSRRQLEQIRRSVAKSFDAVDLVITPTTRVPPLEIADLLSDAATMRPKELLMLHNTRPFDLLGLPTISVPCGFTRSGLPIGLQITGAPGDEAKVLRLALAYEQATNWYKRRPPGLYN